MKCRQLLELIDSGGVAGLTATQRQEIENHASNCDGCAKAYGAARIAAALLEARCAESESVTPPPFFHASVMAAIRSNSIAPNPLTALTRWWNASFSMVAIMLVLVFTLAMVAVFVPREDGEAYTPAGGIYAPDTVIMDQLATREFTNEQALQEIYNHKIEVKK